MIQTRRGCIVTTDQLLPLSWKSSTYECCVLVSNQRALEELKAHTDTIVVAEYKFINLVFLSLQEFSSPAAQTTELPVLRCYVTARKQKWCCVVLWFDISTQGKNNKYSEKRPVITLTCSRNTFSRYHLINCALADNIFLITNWCREWKKKKVTASCILFFTGQGRW